MSHSANQLIHETSPYLLQHAYNPVNWYPWGEEALSKAKAENKPILVSIGYSACHWCHVMERESFEDEPTAKLMNENFINIKIDREERPDLDHIYMDAVQAMTGSGGWPLNVFLTPEGKPFYGGTYFPPRPAYNRSSWSDVLQNVSTAFNERRHEIDAQAENLTEHLLQSNAFGLQKPFDAEVLFTKERMQEAFGNIMKSADNVWGGFGGAPKFPQTFTIQFLLRYYYVYNDESALQQALLSIDKMIEGGIYDQVGGGFARYSTDTEWLAPHFEKMLYDNALLISLLSEAYQLTKKERYKEVIEETMEFLQRELLHTDGGFYAALDADSEGVEGKFYVWDYQQVKDILGEQAELFCEYYDITEKGNWEETNIPRVKEPVEKFAARKKMPADEVESVLKRGRGLLLEERNKRIRPGLDDKIILGWNALMNIACSKAFAATSNEKYRKMALANMEFLLNKFSDTATGGFYHTWKNEQAKYPAFLDDYAFLIQALIQLQEITGNTGWLDKANAIMDFAIGHFSEKETGFFFYTGKDQKDVIVRKKEVYDGALPSGNAIMAVNLYQLSILLDKQEWKQQSTDMASSLGRAISRYPTSFAIWASLSLEVSAGTNEIAIIGKENQKMLVKILRQYIPHRVLVSSTKAQDQYPLLADKPGSDTTNVYLCRDYTCKKPVTSVDALISLIHSGGGA